MARPQSKWYSKRDALFDLESPLKKTIFQGSFMTFFPPTTKSYRVVYDWWLEKNMVVEVVIKCTIFDSIVVRGALQSFITLKMKFA